MSADCFCFVIASVLFYSSSLSHVSASKQVFVDVTSNKLTRENDGAWGLWSYHGNAQESHAAETHFIFNADLLSDDGLKHTSIASMVYPALGLTSDQDAVFQEYLVLQSKVLGVDGFLIEWGYKGHSSDRALQSYLQLAKKLPPFKIGVNWCDHWLMSELKNKTEKEIVGIFHENLQYLIDTIYIHGPTVTPYFKSHPVIFLFGGGLTSSMLKALQALPLNLPPSVTKPVWIGSYLNFASSEELWNEWGAVINGTFGWAPYVLKPTPPDLNLWDFYGDLPDVLQYQKNVSLFGEKCLAEGDCLLWWGSVSPGFDNRGCAGWGRELRLIPRTDLETHTRYTFDAQWDFYIKKNISTKMILIPTLNDFPESTPILALNDSNRSLYSTLDHINEWKGEVRSDIAVPLPMEWYSLYKEVEFYGLTPDVNVTYLIRSLDDASQYLANGKFSKASDVLNDCRSVLKSVVRSLHDSNITLLAPSLSLHPVVAPAVINDSYLINRTKGLYLVVEEDVAALLRKCNYKGLLQFQYLPLNSSLNYLKVYSSTKRKSSFEEDNIYISKGKQGTSTKVLDSFVTVSSDFSVVCNLVTNSTGSWQKATVALFKQNQSWDHSGPLNSDLYFLTEGEYLLQNVTLKFELLGKSRSCGVT